MDPLARLFGSFARLKLLRLFLFNDDTGFGVSDIAFRTKTPSESVRKELRVLVASEVIKKGTGKNGVVYKANKRFPYYDALQEFVRATTSISDTDIANSFKRAGNIKLITLSGLFTRAFETKVDILIVGDKLNENIIESAIHTLEAELGRELRFAVFTTEQYRYRVGIYDRLLRDVFDYDHRNIIDKVGLVAGKR